MCMPITDPGARRHRQLGMVCLVLGLAAQLFPVTFGLPPIPLHFLSGLFLGISIVANLSVVWHRRRC